MIKGLLKKPGMKDGLIIDFKNLAEIRKTIKNALYYVFDSNNQIGIFLSDDGYMGEANKNIIFNQHIIYGAVVFVGISDFGEMKGITKRQRRIVEEYILKHNICKRL